MLTVPAAVIRLLIPERDTYLVSGRELDPNHSSGIGLLRLDDLCLTSFVIMHHGLLVLPYITTKTLFATPISSLLAIITALQ